MTREAMKSLLKRVPLFKELTERELESVVDIAQLRDFNEHEMLFLQGEPLNRVFFIDKGQVKVYRTDVNGKEQIVSIFQSGEMFPHVGFFRSGAFPAHAEVMDAATIVVIPIVEFEQLLLKRPEVYMKLFRVLGEKIIDLQNRLDEQIFHNTYEQILLLFLRLSKKYGQQQEDGYVKLNIQLTNQELANMIGTTRETVSRTLTKLKKNQTLQVSSSGTTLISVDLIKQELQID
ncbi:Crp/Fnr family transcriptional regulator [Alkalihalobacterium elongatum]|uniref:Crp/Fnr family transcriptional regulator n=1 Tax=Alkalihalobacterium elongatum TaxID=2675466 RepID=UPI001C1FE61C|nr:Crp/Fnr family transcriptional regulator [Alkalihalobacterium elongatum]